MIRRDRLDAIMTRVGKARWRLPVVVALSLMAHLLVLGLLAFGAFGPVMNTTRPLSPLYVDIQPRPLLEGERPRPPRTPPPTSTAPLPATADRSMRVTDPPARPEDDDEEAPVTRPATPGLPGRPSSEWAVRPETEGGRVARSLRTSTLGCNARNGRMSAAEQAVCDEAFNEAAAQATPIRGTDNPARDARFAAEGRREIERYEARRRPLAGGTGVTGVGDCPGSNFGMGCPGAHLDPGFRQDTNDQLDQGLSDRDRRDADE